MMRFCIISGGLPPDFTGGAEYQAISLAKELSRNHNVLFVARHKRWKLDKKRRKNLKIIKIPYLNLSFFERIVFLFIVLFQIAVKDRRYDVIISYMPMQAIAGSIVRIILRKKHIYMIRGQREFMNTGVFRRYVLNPFLQRFSDSIVLQSEELKRLYLRDISGSVRDKVVVIPNGIEPRKEKAKGSVVLYVGRLFRGKPGQDDKGIRYLLEAIRLIKKPLVVVGSGPEKKELIKLAEGLPVIFKGRLDKRGVLREMLSARCLVIPSLREGMPTTMLEAMSVGLPVVATRVGAIPEVIEHGKTGFIVEPGDPKAIAEYIMKLYDKNIHNKISKNERLSLNQYAWPNIVKRFEVLSK